ncbi:MAG: biosynthetic-type acetolactate synthase large subunit [Negativicutes bacterium]|nr:biosynthetic-type acetolactate synthase large subunit [Negativicutes bacterium]
MIMSGSNIIVKCLLQQGVDTVFGFPGGAIMPLYDALYDAPIRHILTVHEQGAVHAADGYARSSGRVGVCIATSGPGATNLVTGLATAYMDSSPIVAITGQVSTNLLGHDAFQEVDITGITMPVTKHNFLVKNIDELAETIHLAFSIAATGRPGPVLIDVPRDVLVGVTAFKQSLKSATPNHNSGHPQQEDALKNAALALANARQPLMLIGGGVIAGQAYQEVLSFIKSYHLPVASTLMGLGALPHDNENFLGLTGMHGHKASNYAVREADVVLAVGTRFNDRVTGDTGSYVSGKTVIQLDIDASEMDKNITTNVVLLNELRHSLSQLTDLLGTYPAADLGPWWHKIKTWQQQHSMNYDKSCLNVPWMAHYMSAIDPAVIWVTDVGQHQMWAAQHLNLNGPRSWLTSGGLGTMGFGVPAALGAQAANPTKRVVLIAGDGGFKMTGMELYTMAHQNLPVITVIVNNNSLGMVRQWQQLFFNQRYFHTLLPTNFDFAAFAASCGIAAVAASTADEFTAAFAWALSLNAPAVIIANIATDLLVEPMVRPGDPIDQFVKL